MAPVCPTCNALFSGGDGEHCPACGEVVPAAAWRGRVAPVTSRPVTPGKPPVRPPGAGPDGDDREFGPVGLTVATGLVLVPISSFFGVQGWTTGFLWIWKPSILADLVFTVGTVAAHVGAVEAGRRVRSLAAGVLMAVALAWLLHWIVYAISWELVLAVEPEEEFSLPGGLRFVASVGYFGLSLAALAAGGALVWRRRMESP